MIEGKVADESAYSGTNLRGCTRRWTDIIFVQTGRTAMSGDFAKVRVTGALEYDLIGELTMNTPNKLTVARMILCTISCSFLTDTAGAVDANR